VKGNSHRKRLAIRLLGGFDVRLGDSEVVGFESRKARALFAYVAAHYGQPVGRDQLAALFWPERQEAPARRNLRQALYNVRSTLHGALDVPDILCSTRSSVQLSPDVECWLDTRAFREALRLGLAGERSDPHQLAVAARLYRGDFLDGFLAYGGAAFEAWLCSEQARLRELAIEALRALVEIYFMRGEYRIGLRMALRLVELDPLSEEAHRQLMRLYQMAGRRGRALEHFEELERTLARDLGVEPASETVALKEAILGDEMPNAGGEREDQPLAPLMPLVGRGEELDALARAWAEVRKGGSRVTLVTGDTGMGKTRLIRTYLDTATSRHPGLVLQGRCYGHAAGVSYQPFAAILAEVLTEDPSVVERALAGHDPRLPDRVRRLAHQGTTDALDRSQEGDVVDREAFFAAIREVLELYTDESATSRGVPPLILFLDDLQWADEPTLGLLEALLEVRSDRSMWIIASATTVDDRASGAAIVDRLRRVAGENRVDVIALERLTEADLEEISSTLVGAHRSAELATFLDRFSGRIPLMVAELVNVLWDDGRLEPGCGSDWLLGDLPEMARTTGSRELILHRLERLPTSVRRLLTVAAVAGPKFDTDLLIRAAREHAGVVEIGIEVALERWLVRAAQPFWSTPGREADLVLWSRGARQGAFEFAHETIRRTILESIAPRQRRLIHRALAMTLEERHSGSLDRVREQLAYHWVEARDPRRAARHLLRAAEAAVLLRAESNAADLCRRALKEIRQPRLTHSELTPKAPEDVTIEQVEGLLARLETGLGLTAAGC